ncbi:MAG TPA: YqhA family protein [Candidatus Aquilonibacter sp.]
MRWFEHALWSSRYIVLVPVVACVLISLLLFGIVTIEASQLPAHLSAFIDPSFADIPRTRLYSDGIASIARVIDGYLFATIMLIFAMGLYELFIGKIDVAEKSPIAERVLLIRSFDDLKDRLAKVVFLILIVTYFEYALRGTYDTGQDLLYLAAGIALVAAAIWLTSRTKH